MNKLYSLVTLAVVSVVGAAVAVETDPVGFSTVTAPANSDLSVTLPLHRSTAFQGAVTGVSGNVISLNATFTASQFVYASPGQINTYYVSVRSTVSLSSAVKGKWFSIVSNTTSSVTVDPDGPSSVETQGLVVGDTIEIIPFWTLNTLFPNGQGLTITTDIDSPQDLIFTLPQNVAGINLQASLSFLYCDDPVNLGTPGWYAAGTFTSTSPGGVSWADYPLAPDTFIRFRNRGAATTLTLTGAVPTSDVATVIARLASNQQQDNFVVNPFPVAISLPETGLFESGAFQVTTDIDSPKDLLLVFDGTETGFNSQPSKIYLYCDDPANLPQAGWYASGTFAGPYGSTSKLIPAGAALVVRKAAGPVASTSWKMGKPY